MRAARRLGYKNILCVNDAAGSNIFKPASGLANNVTVSENAFDGEGITVPDKRR